MFLRKSRKNIYRFSMICICFLFSLLRNISVVQVSGGDLSSYIELCFGGFPISGSFDIIAFLLWMMPNLLIIYCFSDFMKDDCLINYVYVFTRLNKKSRWLFRKSAHLLFCILILFVILLGLGFVIGRASGLPYTMNRADYAGFLSIFFLNSLAFFYLCMIQNFLSLKWGEIPTFIVVGTIYVVSIMIAVTSFHPNRLVTVALHFLIPTHQMYIWHADAAVALGQTIDHLYLFESYLFLLVGICLFYAVAGFIFEKFDLLEMLKED